MSTPPDIDLYAVLGVSKDATTAEIRAAHRKRVLKCHPDKVQDESQRAAAQDEFQKVQQAYELLSDDTRRARYDQQAVQKAKLEQLKREVREHRRTESAYATPRGSGSAQEFRHGHKVEEREPMSSFFDEDIPFTEEPRPMGRKYQEYGTRPMPRSASKTRAPSKSRAPSKTRSQDKTRTPLTSDRAAREAREAKAAQEDRARRRDQERQRQTSEKYNSFSAANDHSNDDVSDDSSGSYYVRLKMPRRARESRESRRPSEPSHRRERAYEEDDYPDRYANNKHDSWHTQAKKHIERTKYEGERPRNSRSPRRSSPKRTPKQPSPQRTRGYEATEPEAAASRHPARSSRSTRDRSSSRNNSYEHLDSSRNNESKPPKMPSPSTRGSDFKSPKMPSSSTIRSTQDQSSSRSNSYEHLDSRSNEKPPKLSTASTRTEEFKPKMPSAATSPAYKTSSMRPSFFTRSATHTGFQRSKSSREGSILDNMVHEAGQVRSKKYDPYDSGYSSPRTPEMPGNKSPKATARYTYDEPRIIIEPKSKYRSSSPEKDRDRDREGPSRTTPKRSSTLHHESVSSTRPKIQSVRPLRKYGEVQYSPHVRPEDITYHGRVEDVKYTHIRPNDATVSAGRSSHSRHPPPIGPRRQSAYT
ncbi:hypothetical protein N7495_005741 [Penicillium taxi]|uniref:uncharacterized protein n=1 Tax=Penicillium taxi TaxID=168475 RepID=UPI0025458B2A|nr:uncharacterized protein N7495_005741 [Penicillium taxi]KAJ5894050.1 hypothetical protein N7495_005741 [Penicillium taxi]